ncbi:hypothetical protein [Kineococcus sp. SYSU DK001]|uniref:hypothetical protein n=1 Tax=Kineococcus sp. SYSU DK001 TaxID=3383122 RepID=UPI003D7DC33C
MAASPPALRRPVAYGVTTLAVAGVVAAGGIPTALSWFAPVHLVELLLAHLLAGGDHPAPDRAA